MGFRRKTNKLSRSDSIVFDYPGNETLKESYTRLKDNILYFSSDGGNVIQIESSINDESKTTTACNLAVCLGLSGKKVVLVDLDFRKARVHRHFFIKNELGIVDYLIDEACKDELIKKTNYPNLSIINKGNDVDNATILLSSIKLKNLINELKMDYDFVLLDCPPVLLVSDYIPITKLSDGILFLVAHGKTCKNRVSEAIKLLKGTNSKIIGAVFTFYKPRKNENYLDYSKY